LLAICYYVNAFCSGVTLLLRLEKKVTSNLHCRSLDYRNYVVLARKVLAFGVQEIDFALGAALYIAVRLYIDAHLGF